MTMTIDYDYDAHLGESLECGREFWWYIVGMIVTMTMTMMLTLV